MSEEPKLSLSMSISRKLNLGNYESVAATAPKPVKQQSCDEVRHSPFEAGGDMAQMAMANFPAGNWEE